MRQESNNAGKKPLNLKCGRAISCEKHSRERSVNEVQQKKIVEVRNSILRDSLEDIEED